MESRRLGALNTAHERASLERLMALGNAHYGPGTYLIEEHDPLDFKPPLPPVMDI